MPLSPIPRRSPSTREAGRWSLALLRPPKGCFFVGQPKEAKEQPLRQRSETRQQSGRTAQRTQFASCLKDHTHTRKERPSAASLVVCPLGLRMLKPTQGKLPLGPPQTPPARPHLKPSGWKPAILFILPSFYPPHQ